MQNNRIRKYDPNGTLIGSFAHGNNWAQGCAIGDNSDVSIAHSLNRNMVGHLMRNGTYVGKIVVGAGPTGMAVDGNGYVWSTNFNSNMVSRINPSLNDGIGAVDLTVALGPGAGPYNYGDMTGSLLAGIPKIGSWTVVVDSGNVGQNWSCIQWMSTVPGNSNVVVEARSSVDDLTYSAYQTASQDNNLLLPEGEYL